MTDKSSSPVYSLPNDLLAAVESVAERRNPMVDSVACCARAASGHAAEQRDELSSSYAEHRLLPGTRCASLPQAQDAPEAPAGPWDTLNCSESF
jgi:hypothetical protein